MRVAGDLISDGKDRKKPHSLNSQAERTPHMHVLQTGGNLSLSKETAPSVTLDLAATYIS